MVAAFLPTLLGIGGSLFSGASGVLSNIAGINAANQQAKANAQNITLTGQLMQKQIEAHNRMNVVIAGTSIQAGIANTTAQQLKTRMDIAAAFSKLVGQT